MEFTQFVDGLKPAELKKVISSLNKLVKAELVISVRGKTHDELKQAVKTLWSRNQDSLELMPLKKSVDVVEAPLKLMAEKAMAQKQKRAEASMAKKATKTSKMEDDKVVRAAQRTLARIAEKAAKAPPKLTESEQMRKKEFEEKLKTRKGKPNFM